MPTSLIISTKDHLTDTLQTKSLTNVNPAASKADLQTFAQMTTALSADSLVKAIRIDETDLSVTKTVLDLEIKRTSSAPWSSTDNVVNVPFSVLSSSNEVNLTLRFVDDTPNQVYFDIPVVASEDFQNISVNNTALFGNSKLLTCRISLGEKKVGTFTVLFNFHFDDQFEPLKKLVSFNVTE